jgi:hypothetical protein
MLDMKNSHNYIPSSSNINLVILWGIILYSFYWFLLGAFYCHPNAEDLSLCGLSRDKGIILGALEMLATYDGRYFTNILHGINPLAFNWYHGYKWMPLLGIVGLAGSITFLLRAIFSKSISLFTALTFSLIITVIHLATVPSISHHLYWMVSSFVYLYPHIFVFLWLSCYINFYKSGSVTWLCIAIIFLVLSNGLNEMFLSLNLILVSSILWFSIIKRDALFAPVVIILAGLFSTVAFISYPGIISRVESLEMDREGVSAINFLYLSLKQFFEVCFDWIVKKPVFIVVTAFIGHYFSYQCSFQGMLRFKFLIVPFTLVVMYAMTLAYYIPMSVKDDPSRIYGSVQLVFMTGLILFFAVFFNQVKIKVSQKVFSGAVFISFLFNSGNIFNIKEEYQSGIFKTFQLKMESNFQILSVASAPAQKCWTRVEIVDVFPIPSTIAHDPYILPNRELPFWNQSYERYFYLDEVTLKGDTLSMINFIE